MAVCPICGCKTEELDFVERKLQEKECKICSFCDRQLKVFDSETGPTGAQLRWLDAVIAKDVPERGTELSTILEKFSERYPDDKSQQAAETQTTKESFQSFGGQYKATPKMDDFEEENKTIKDLQKRVAALEAEIRFMKRKQMIKTALELGIPAVLFILLIIIVTASGIIDKFKVIFDMVGYF